MSVEVIGAELAASAIAQMVEAFNADMVSAFNDTSEKLQRDTRANHRYNRRTGALDESIKSEVEHVPGEYVSLRFFIDPDRVTTDKGWNYGWIQNDGSSDGYRQGAISPPSSPKNRDRRGIAHDDFMGRQWQRHFPKLSEKVQNIFARMDI